MFKVIVNNSIEQTFITLLEAENYANNVPQHWETKVIVTIEQYHCVLDQLNKLIMKHSALLEAVDKLNTLTKELNND